MPLNLLNEKDINQYLTTLIFAHEQIPSFTDSQSRTNLQDPTFIESHKDSLIKSMLLQYMKHRIRTHLINSPNVPFLTPVDSTRPNLPKWTQNSFAQNVPIYEFNADKIPADLRNNLTTIRDFLYDSAQKYLETQLRVARESQKPVKLKLEYLKTKNEFATFDNVLHQADVWHNIIAQKADKRQKDTALKKQSEIGTEKIMDLSDGMYVVRLLTPEALDFESDNMGHCVGKGNYDSDIKSGKIQMYSIRDSKGVPHATLEVRDGQIWQCRGKTNNGIIAKYAPYLATFVNKQKLDFDYDINHSGLIENDGVYYSINHLPKGLVIEGDLNLSNFGLSELPDLTHVIVKGDLNISNNNLTSLKGCPSEIGRSFACSKNPNLRTLEGGPQKVGGNYYCSDCGLISLKGCPQIIHETFNCSLNKELQTLEDGPEIVGEYYDCLSCGLISLKGCPQIIGEDFDCSKNPNLQTLEDGPREVGGNYGCLSCGLISLKGCPQEIGKEFNCSHNPNLQTLKDGPVKVGGNYYCYNCGLISLKGCSQKIGGNFNCSTNPNLQTLEGGPQEVDRNYDCSSCGLISLKGCSQKIGEGFRCSENPQLKDLIYTPVQTEVMTCQDCPALTNQSFASPNILNYPMRGISYTKLQKMVANYEKFQKRLLQQQTTAKSSVD